MKLDSLLDRLIPACLVLLLVDTIWAIGSAAGVFQLTGLPLALAIVVNVPLLLVAAVWLVKNHRQI